MKTYLARYVMGARLGWKGCGLRRSAFLLLWQQFAVRILCRSSGDPQRFRQDGRRKLTKVALLSVTSPYFLSLAGRGESLASAWLIESCQGTRPSRTPVLRHFVAAL